jgi:hypothetical protein
MIQLRRDAVLRILLPLKPLKFWSKAGLPAAGESAMLTERVNY